MHKLESLQVWSFVSRLLAMLLGMAQTFVIVRLLSVHDWGLVQLAMSIGGAFGIYQHLGLASGSTREISATQDPKEVPKIFFTSAFIRYTVTIPIFVFLFFSAPAIAIDHYNAPELVLPLRLYAVGLLVEAIQSILNAVVSGTHRFKQLFVYQVAIAVVSVCLYIPLIYLYGLNGYFYALFAFQFISSVVMGVIALWPYRAYLTLPSLQDFKRLIKELLSISLAIYAVKILYTWWEKSGPILLGLRLTSTEVAFFSFALLYAKKLMLVSDSVTTVNLPVLSKEYTRDFSNFSRVFVSNFNKLFAFILGLGWLAILWSPEVFTFLVGSNKYATSIPLVLPLVFAFVAYSYMNILQSSVVIPSKRVTTMLVSFGGMLVGTLGIAKVLMSWVAPIQAMAVAVCLGSFLGLGLMSWFIHTKLNLRAFSWKHLLLFFLSFGLAFPYMYLSFWSKFLYTFLALLGYFVAILNLRFVSKEDLKRIIQKFNR